MTLLPLHAWPHEYLRDLNVADDAPDQDVIDAIETRGFDADGPYFRQVLNAHHVRRYEALTGLPF